MDLSGPSREKTIPCAQGWPVRRGAEDEVFPARRDVPPPFQEDSPRVLCFPCAQGWPGPRPASAIRADVFPLRAGMARCSRCKKSYFDSVSHARRAGPLCLGDEVRHCQCCPRAGMSLWMSSCKKRCCPCAQGWTEVKRKFLLSILVFPMRAGLDRAFHGVPVFPARRDVPLALRSMDRDRGCFPRRRDGPQWPLP